MVSAWFDATRQRLQQLQPRRDGALRPMPKKPKKEQIAPPSTATLDKLREAGQRFEQAYIEPTRPISPEERQKRQDEIVRQLKAG